MSAWTQVKLSQIASSVDYGHTASSTSEAIGPKFLRITDIQEGNVNWEAVPFCECSPADEISSQLKPGDIVFARTGATTGKSFLIKNCPNRAIFASYLIRVRAKSTVLPDYLAHFFKTPSYWSQVSLNARGAAQLGVNATSLKSLSVPLPPIAEQKRITGILDKAEELRGLRRKALEQLDAIAQSSFLEMFGDPLTNPKGWMSNMSLGEVADIASGITKGRKLSGKATREIPYLAVINVQDRALNLNILKTIEASEDEISRYRLKKDDLLLTEGGDPDKLGRGTLWSEEIPECIHQNHVFRVRLTSNSIHPLFLNWLVGSQRGKQYFLKSAKQTTGIATINMTQLRGFPLLIPPTDLQEKFARRVDVIEQLKVTHRESLAQLDALFASLQHRAFRGEL